MRSFPFSFHSQKGKLSDHKGDLSRVLRSYPNVDGSAESQQNGHAFLYDIVLVLGGKLNGIPRNELQYTTAAEEGMTGDSRQRRKRKHNVTKDENNSANDTTSSAAAKNKKTNTVNGKITTTKTTNTNKKRGKATIATTTASFNSNGNGNGIGMFEKHRREFERSLLRLQKLDFYNFFSEYDIPPEFDEYYDSSDLISEMHTTASLTSITEVDALLSDMPIPSTEKNQNDNEEKTDSVTFPNYPPYNFVVLRKRLEQNRYIINRQCLAKTVESFHAENIEDTVTDGKMKRSSSCSLQNPIGIHWELFRDDVIGMCNAAVERNTDNLDDGSTGSLSNAADKIKLAMEQIYEKTGRRQSQEMELANDAHTFTKVIEATENKEAAMQGKSWRKKGKQGSFD